MIYNILTCAMILVTLSGCAQGSMPTVEFITNTWIWSLMAFITIASIIIRLIRDSRDMFKTQFLFLIFGVILIAFGIWGYWDGGYTATGGKGISLHSYWSSWLWVFFGGLMIVVYTFFLPDRSDEKK